MNKLMDNSKIALALVVSLSSCAGWSYAEETSDREIKEMAETVIVMSGYLCAKVTDIKPSADDGVYQVTCIEYGGESGVVRYLVNAQTSTVIEVK